MLDRILIVIYNVLILLMPYALNYKGISYSKILFVFSLLVTGYLIIEKQITKKTFENQTFKYLTFGFFIFFICVFISNVVSFISNKSINLTDVFEIVRAIQYYLLILNYSVLLNSKENKKIFDISIIGLFILNIILAFFQFHNLFGLNEKYIHLIAPTQYETLVNNYNWPRAVGLAGNPNVFGFIISLSSIYFLQLIIKNYKKISIYLLYILSVIGVFLAASRTSYVTLVLGGGFLILISYFKLNKKDILKVVSLEFIFILVHLILLIGLPNKYTWRIKALVKLDNLNSWQQRVDKNNSYIDSIINNNKEEEKLKVELKEEEEKQEIKENQKYEEKKQEHKIKSQKMTWYNYLIGKGSNKLNKVKNYDNEWIQLFDYYGIIGLLGYIIMFLLPLFTLKMNKEFNYKLYLSVVVMNLIYMIPAATYNCYLLFGLSCVLYAYCLSNLDKKLKIKKKS